MGIIILPSKSSADLCTTIYKNLLLNFTYISDLFFLCWMWYKQTRTQIQKVGMPPPICTTCLQTYQNEFCTSPHDAYAYFLLLIARKLQSFSSPARLFIVYQRFPCLAYAIQGLTHSTDQAIVTC